MIDVSISNALNSGFDNIFILSQYLSSTINNYVVDAYPYHKQAGGQMTILSPEETLDKKVWYKGNADSIRQNMKKIFDNECEHFIILSGDQLYTMDLHEMLITAKKKDADLTIAALPVVKKDAMRMGVMQIDGEMAITNFYEKPQTDELLNEFAISNTPSEISLKKEGRDYLASMGIYIFKRQVLYDLLSLDPREDFGKHLVQTQIKRGGTYAYIFDGYWEDVGTIGSFYEANINIAKNADCIDLHNDNHPISSKTYGHPSARLKNTKLKNAVICDGSIIEADSIEDSIVGLGSRIGPGTKIAQSIIMGNHASVINSHTKPPFSECHRIGKNCVIRNAIIDENCEIGDNVTLTNEKKLDHYDGEGLFVREGVIVLRANTKIPDNFRF